jgi:hypothetical protein
MSEGDLRGRAGPPEVSFLYAHDTASLIAIKERAGRMV